MIPKTIHYCWFGGNPKPKMTLKCIESWKKYCPDYEIIEWNEENWNVDQCGFEYAKEAYACKKWAFVSDIARLDIISNHGGIYLDTDVEIKEPLDNLLSNKAFFAFESQVVVALGLGFGAERGNEIVQSMLTDYNGCRFLRPNGEMDCTPSPSITTKTIRKWLPELLMSGKTQEFDDVTIIGCADYHMFAQHHYSGSWREGPIDAPKSAEKSKFLKRMLRYPNLERILYRCAPECVYRAYVFPHMIGSIWVLDIRLLS